MSDTNSSNANRTSDSVDTTSIFQTDNDANIDQLQNNTEQSTDLSESTNSEILSSTVLVQPNHSSQRFNSVWCKMLKYILHELIFFIIGIIFTTYAAYHSSQPKISSPPAARPFFSDGSIVTDWFRGDLRSALLRSKEHDITFLMYYAPWDAESQSVRYEFELAANFYHKQVHFAAVNCWQPRGDCKLLALQHSKQDMRIWPGLVAHRGQKGIVYRGPHTAPYFIRFLKNVINPLHRVTSTQDLIELVEIHDAVVYATVSTALEYSIFYKVALRLLEVDPFREVAVAISTSPIPENQIETPSLQLITANGTIINVNRNWTTNYLVAWTLKHLHRPIGWTTPPSLGKSHMLASFLQNNPTLLVFTPRNPFLDFEYRYQLMRTISLQYYNCQDNPNDEYFVETVINGIQKRQNELEKTYKQCILEEQRFKKLQKSNWLKTNEYSFSVLNKNVNTCFANSFNQKQSMKDFCWKGNCLDDNNRETEDELFSMFSSSASQRTWKPDDIYSPDYLLKLKTHERCRFVLASKKMFNQFEKISIKHKILKSNEINALSCKTNMTLAITVLDSLRFPLLANALGIDIQSKPDQTAVVIVNAADESHFIMNETFTYQNVIKFIVNFTGNFLSPDLLPQINKYNSPQHYDIRNETNCISNANSICLMELTTDTFLPTVMEYGKAFVALYYSSYCGFCTDASRIFLTVAHIFRPLNFIKFVRLDGEKNPLPWQYDMPQYPTILFFPARRKAESRAFPQEAIRTVPNLINFVVTNLEPAMNLKALWLLCHHKPKVLDNLKICLRNLRQEVAKLIQKTTKQWRYVRNANSSNSQGVMKRLKYLKTLYLLLGYTNSTKFKVIESLIQDLQTIPWFFNTR